MIGTSWIVISTPTTAEVPPTPARDPTDLPEKKSLGRVWMLPIEIWNPNRISAISSTATSGVEAAAVNNSEGSMITPPRAMVNLRALLIVQPLLITRPASQPPNIAPAAAPT